MKNSNFPFPGKELAKEELLRDFSINKIPESDLDLIVDIAWDKGIEASKFIKNNHSDYKDFKNIVGKFDLKVVDKDKDFVVGNTRFFSEYYTKKNEIVMYLKSIKMWSKSNDLSFEQGYNLILCHEFFHFLEYTKFGLTSKLYKRPWFKIGEYSFGKTGVKAMSEIGAHSFVYNLFVKEKNL